MQIKTVSLIGLGALGILFGNQMHSRMPGGLRIIADRARIARYQREGVYCNGQKCDFVYAAPDDPCPKADLLLFAVKFNDLPAAVEAARGHVGPDTVILSLLNGISSEQIIGRAYGEEKVLCCVAQGMDAVKAGNRLTYQHMGMLSFGGRSPGESAERVKAAAEFFGRVGIPYETPDDMQKRMWGKFMLNVGVNQTSAVYGCPYGRLQEEGPARDLMKLAMREALALAPREGVGLAEEDIAYWLRILSTLSPDGKPSMLQDVENKRPTEAALFAGTVLDLGKKHGVPTPVNALFYERIRAMEGAY